MASPEGGAAAQGSTPTTRRAVHAPTGTGPAGRIPSRTGLSSSVEAIVDLLETTIGTGDGRRLLAVEDELWLADPADRAAAADPISDRIEWAVVTTLATSGPIEPERVVDVVVGRLGLDHPLDRALLSACLESYAVPTGDGRLVVAREDVVRRSQEHSRILARLVELGHSFGFTVWLPPRERTRRLGGASLEALLTERERHARLGAVVSAPASALEGLDAVWYVRGRATFLFEVEWTAMLGLPVLRRGPQIPTDERTVRFLVLAPERRELVRAKLARSAYLRATLAADNWHVLLWNHLEVFAGLERPSLAALEPFLGLDARVERLGGDQLGLFEGDRSGGGPG